MNREQLQTRLAENIEWLRQKRLERDKLEDEVMALSIANEGLRIELAAFDRPVLRSVK